MSSEWTQSRSWDEPAFDWKCSCGRSGVALPHPPSLNQPHRCWLRIGGTCLNAALLRRAFSPWLPPRKGCVGVLWPVWRVCSALVWSCVHSWGKRGCFNLMVLTRWHSMVLTAAVFAFSWVRAVWAAAGGSGVSALCCHCRLGQDSELLKALLIGKRALH